MFMHSLFSTKQKQYIYKSKPYADKHNKNHRDKPNQTTPMPALLQPYFHSQIITYKKQQPIKSRTKAIMLMQRRIRSQPQPRRVTKTIQLINVSQWRSRHLTSSNNSLRLTTKGVRSLIETSNIHPNLLMNSDIAQHRGNQAATNDSCEVIE